MMIGPEASLIINLLIAAATSYLILFVIESLKFKSEFARLWWGRNKDVLTGELVFTKFISIIATVGIYHFLFEQYNFPLEIRIPVVITICMVCIALMSYIFKKFPDKEA